MQHATPSTITYLVITYRSVMQHHRLLLLPLVWVFAGSLQAQTWLTLTGGPVYSYYESPVQDPHTEAHLDDGLSGWNINGTFIAPWMGKENAHSGLLAEIGFQLRQFSMTDSQGGLGGGASESLSVTSVGLELCLAPWWSFAPNGRFRFSAGPSVHLLLDSRMSGTAIPWNSPDPPLYGVSEVEGSANQMLNSMMIALVTQLHWTAPIGKQLGLDLGIRGSRTFDSVLSEKIGRAHV